MQRGIGGQWSYCERNNFAGPMLRGGERVTVPLHYTVLFLLGKAEQETLEQEDRVKADLPAPSDEIQLTFFHPGQWSYCGAKGTTRLLCQGGESTELPL